MCKGVTVHGVQCKRPTKNENGYCYYHQEQVPKPRKRSVRKKPVPPPKPAKQKPVPPPKPAKKVYKTKECAICFEPVKAKDVLKCGHMIHMSCVNQCMKPECPVCRAPVKVCANVYKKMVERQRELNHIDLADILFMYIN